MGSLLLPTSILPSSSTVTSCANTSLTALSILPFADGQDRSGLVRHHSDSLAKTLASVEASCYTSCQIK